MGRPASRAASSQAARAWLTSASASAAVAPNAEHASRSGMSAMGIRPATDAWQAPGDVRRSAVAERVADQSADCDDVVGFQLWGSNASMSEAGWVSMRMRTSAR